MAIVDFDSFDHYGSNADLLEGNYLNTGGAPPVWGATNGRFGGPTGTKSSTDTIGTALAKAFTGLTTLGVGVVLQTPSSYSVENSLIALWETGTSRFSVGITTSYAIQVRSGAQASGTIRGTSANNVVPANSWVHIEVRVVRATTAVGSFEVRVNGTSVLNVTNVITADAGTEYNEMRLTSSNASGAHEHLVDSWVIWDTTGSVSNNFLGDIRVRSIVPNADDASTDWVRNTGSNDYEAVDELDADDDTTYVSAASAPAKSKYGLTSLPVTPSAIHGVKAIAKARKDDAGAATFQVGVDQGGTESLSSAVSVTTGYLDYQRVLTVDPVSGVAFTNSDIDSLKAVINRAA